MEELNLKIKKKKWDIYHKYERKDKKRRLRKLSKKESFIILKNLHHFTHQMDVDASFNILDMDKIRTLAYIHNVFGKVEP